MIDHSVTEQQAAGLSVSRPIAKPYWVGLLPLLIVPLIVGLDQLTKWIVRSSMDRGDVWPGDWVVRVVHVTNNGAAFGMLQNSGPLLLITTLLGVIGITVYFLMLKAHEPLLRIGLALMLGGAVGNLVDRLANGRVVDFIKVPNFPAFNVADSAITIGVVLLVWAMTFRDSKSNERA
jgi:signal peptidase II